MLMFALQPFCPCSSFVGWMKSSLSNIPSVSTSQLQLEGGCRCLFLLAALYWDLCGTTWRQRRPADSSSWRMMLSLLHPSCLTCFLCCSARALLQIPDASVIFPAPLIDCRHASRCVEFLLAALHRGWNPAVDILKIPFIADVLRGLSGGCVSVCPGLEKGV